MSRSERGDQGRCTEALWKRSAMRWSNSRTDEVKVKIIGFRRRVASTETDATLAAAIQRSSWWASTSRADASAHKVIESESLDLRYCSVIY